MSGSDAGDWRQSNNWRSPGPSIPGPSRATPSERWRNDQESRSRTASYTRSKARPSEPGPVANDASNSIAEGRRVYLGNILYRVEPHAIEQMLKDHGFEDRFEGIHISVDAVTGRNPGYCFVDFMTREDANEALSSLGGVTILDRPVKVGPCQPKGAERRWKSDGYKPTFQRWGDWHGSRGKGFGQDGGAAVDSHEQGPQGALDHLEEVKKGDPPPRLYVGGLGRMINQEQNDAEIRVYFEGFNIVAISKRITPHPDTRSKPGNHHYCFVDFESIDEARKAIDAANGRVIPGGRLRIQLAGVLPKALQ